MLKGASVTLNVPRTSLTPDRGPPAGKVRSRSQSLRALDSRRRENTDTARYGNLAPHTGKKVPYMVS